MLLNNEGVKVIESDVKNGNLICFLLGAPGIGKSSIMQYIAEKNKWHFYQLLCNQIAMQADLTGCRTVSYTKPDGTEDFKQVFFPHAVIKDAIDTALTHPNDKVLLFLDEINRTSAAVTSAILTFITARTIGTEKLPDNIILVAAGNDDGNVITLDQASLSRFIIRRCEPDATTFLGLGKIHPIIEELLKQQAALIYQDKCVSVDENQNTIFSEDDNEFKQIATPRTIMGLNKALFDNTKMIMSMDDKTLKEYIAGFTGDTLFTEAVHTSILANKMKLTTAAITAPDRPACLDQLTSATMITDIQAIAASLSDQERSHAILYMLYDKTHDYNNIMSELAKAYGQSMLMDNDQTQLTTLINNGEFNRDAYDTLVGTECTIGRTLKMIYPV